MSVLVVVTMPQSFLKVTVFVPQNLLQVLWHKNMEVKRVAPEQRVAKDELHLSKYSS